MKPTDAVIVHYCEHSTPELRALTLALGGTLAANASRNDMLRQLEFLADLAARMRAVGAPAGVNADAALRTPHDTPRAPDCTDCGGVADGTNAGHAAQCPRIEDR